MMQVATTSLQSDGFVHLKSAPSGQYTQLEIFWDAMPRDPHMPDGHDYRRRRLGRFKIGFDHDGDAVTSVLATSPRPFRQSKEINHFVGGMDREFAPLAENFHLDSGFRRLLENICRWLPRQDPDGAVSFWAINVHQIRIEATALRVGKPAPEGVHRDGHDFVAQVLIARDAALAGGVSVVCDESERPIYEATLRHPGECILLDDRRLKHFTSDISLGAASLRGHRDMLLIDFNRLTSGGESQKGAE